MKASSMRRMIHPFIMPLHQNIMKATMKSPSILRHVFGTASLLLLLTLASATVFAAGPHHQTP